MRKALISLIEKYSGRKVVLKENVEQLISDELPNITNLECDGATRVFDYVLRANNIPYKVYVGQVLMRTKKGWEVVIPLHYWIVLKNGQIIDYKAQMWLDNKAPNGFFETKSTKKGIFMPKEFPQYMYKGKEIQLNTSQTVYNILVMSGVD